MLQHDGLQESLLRARRTSAPCKPLTSKPPEAELSVGILYLCGVLLRDWQLSNAGFTIPDNIQTLNPPTTPPLANPSGVACHSRKALHPKPQNPLKEFTLTRRPFYWECVALGSSLSFMFQDSRVFGLRPGLPQFFEETSKPCRI